MGLLDMLFGGEGQPQQNSLPMEELRQLGLSDGLINYYQQEQAKAQKAQMWNNAINGIANITSSAQGMGPRFGGGGDGGGGSSGPGANSPLGLDGLVDRALRFSQVREGIAKQKQMAEARAAIPALAARLNVPAEVVAAMDPSDLSKMYQQVREADLNAQAEIRKQDAAFEAAGIPPEKRQAIRAQAFEPQTEQTTIKAGDGSEVTAFKKRNPASATGFDLVGPDGKPYETPQAKWKMETLKTPGGDFTVAVRPNPQAPSGFDVIDAVSGKPVDLAALQQQSIAAAAEKKGAEESAKNISDKQATFGRAMTNFDELEASIKDILNDPNLDKYVGSNWGMLMSNVAGSDARNIASKINQVKSRAFMIGSQSLKGLGSQTEMEGAKAESSLVNADPGQDVAQFRKSLQDTLGAIQRGRQMATQEAGFANRSGSQPSAAGASDWQQFGDLGRVRRKQ